MGNKQSKPKRCTSADFDVYFRRFFQEYSACRRGALLTDDTRRSMWWCVEYFWKAVAAHSSQEHPRTHMPPDAGTFSKIVKPDLVKHAPSQVTRVDTLFKTLTASFSKDNPPARMDAHYEQDGTLTGAQPQLQDIDLLACTLVTLRRGLLRSVSALAGEPASIAVLTGQVKDSPYAHPGGPAFWKNELMMHAKGIPVQLVQPDEIRPWNVAVLNPHGEAYPEDLKDNLLPFIASYLDYGGVWITTGGVPFYYRSDMSDTSIVIPYDANSMLIPPKSMRISEILGYCPSLAMQQENTGPEAFTVTATVKAHSLPSAPNSVRAFRYLLDLPATAISLISGKRLSDARTCHLAAALPARAGFLIYCGLFMDGQAHGPTPETSLFVDALLELILPFSGSCMLR